MSTSVKTGLKKIAVVTALFIAVGAASLGASFVKPVTAASVTINGHDLKRGKDSEKVYFQTIRVWRSDDPVTVVGQD